MSIDLRVTSLSKGTWNESWVPYLEHSEVCPEAEVGVDVPEGLARAGVEEVRDVVGRVAPARWQVSQTKPNWTCKIEQIYLNKWSICQKPFAQNTNWPRSQLNKTLLEQIPIPQILITQFFHSTDLNWPKSVLNIVDWTWFCSIDHSTILWRMIIIIGPSHNESKP